MEEMKRTAMNTKGRVIKTYYLINFQRVDLNGM